MTRGDLRWFGLVTFALAIARPAAAERPWYAPDHVKVQYAGAIGYVSPGVGWATRDRGVEADVFFGWVPQAIVGEDVYSLTGKLSFQPWRQRIGQRWLVRPLSGGLQITYTFGSQYFVRAPPQYPSGYWDGPSALRGAVAVGGSAAYLTGRAIREVGVYWELVALDLRMVYWVRNPRTVGPEDVFTLALGVRLGF